MNTLKFFESICTRSWWVILFMLLCYGSYEQGLRQRDRDFDKLSKQHRELQDIKKYALDEQEDLRTQLNSQSDPDWIELTLIKGLGLVAEGQIKVLFTQDTDGN